MGRQPGLFDLEERLALLSALPGYGRAGNRPPVRGDDAPDQPILHITLQHRVERQLHRLGTAGGPVGVPLRGGGPILQTAAARGGVAAQLAGDRGRRSLQPTGDLAHAVPSSMPDCDLLPLHKRQVPPRWGLRGGRKRRRSHAARLPEPPHSYRRRHPCANRRVLTPEARGNRRPEPQPFLAPRYPRPAGRP